MNTTTKPFDYAAFIHELTVLRDSYVNPPHNHRTHDSTEFKLWRHQIIDLIDRIQAQGYGINCDIHVRPFRVISYGSISSGAQLAAFDNALAQTMIELNTIISNFEKYGDPKAPPPAAVQTPPHTSTLTSKQLLEWKKEATFMWYLKNTPAATLLSFGTIVFGLIAAAFAMGVAVEKRWPESKSPVAADGSSMVLPPVQQPLSTGPAQHPPTDEQQTGSPKVMPRVNGQPAIGQGPSSSQGGEKLGLSSSTSAPQSTSTESK